MRSTPKLLKNIIKISFQSLTLLLPACRLSLSACWLNIQLNGEEEKKDIAKLYFALCDIITSK